MTLPNGLDRLSRAGIPTFVVHGNHDPVDEGWSAVRSWPDGVTVFGAKGVETVPVVRDGRTLALLHGMSYPKRAVTDNLSRLFRRDPSPCFQVGVLHCNAGAVSGHEAYSPCSIDDLVASGLDYWALGHIHLRQVLRDDHPFIGYPGNLQGLSPKPSEQGAKGALLIEVDGSNVAEIQFLPLDVVRFDEVAVEITEIPDVAGCIDALADAVRDRVATHGGRAVILRAILTGRGPLYRDLHRGSPAELLLPPARAALESSEPPVWLDAVEDQTRPELDIEALRGRGDFAADLIAQADLLIDSAQERSRVIKPYVEQIPQADLRRIVDDRLDTPPDDEEIRSALAVSLDHVMGLES